MRLCMTLQSTTNQSLSRTGIREGYDPRIRGSRRVLTINGFASVRRGFLAIVNLAATSTFLWASCSHCSKHEDQHSQARGKRSNTSFSTIQRAYSLLRVNHEPSHDVSGTHPESTLLTTLRKNQIQPYYALSKAISLGIFEIQGRPKWRRCAPNATPFQQNSPQACGVRCANSILLPRLL